jgi:hypothetical protein
MKTFFRTSLFSIILIKAISINQLCAQNNEFDWRKAVLAKDSAFWVAFNACDIESNAKFIAADVEFYHDKGGLTLGLENLNANTKRNLCSGNFSLRREAVKGSYFLYPLKKDNELYGAILSGEHVFFVKENGKNEWLDGLAKFTHVWMFKDNDWKMTRVLSYDHGPALRSK